VTIAELLPGNMGRVVLTRAALKLRKPELLRMDPTTPLDPELLEQLTAAVDAVRKG
jgi:ABC-type polar amino acid transport system ATPase subunit